MKRFIVLVICIIYITLFIISIIFINTIGQYLTFEKTIGFLKYKQNIVDNKLWISLFYGHIFSIIFCLIAGFTQFSGSLLSSNNNIHKIMGRFYAYNILFLNVPVCFVLSFFANGGFLGKIGFIFQTFLWFWFTLMGIISIKKKEIKKHRIYMILSFSITTTAITFRIFKYLFFQLSTLEYHSFYGLNVWVTLIFNLSVGITIIFLKKNKLPARSGINCDNK